MKFIVASLAVAFAAVFAPHADAAGMFGEQDNFNTLMKMKVPDALIAEYGLPKEWAGDATELDGHSTSLFIFGGVNVTDHGYAIRVQGTDNYWDLTPELTALLQEKGVLPNPLPPHDIALIDLLFGYSLWIIIAGLVAWYGGKALLFRKKPDAEPPTEEPPAAA